jgi:hypothetical protein
VSFACSARLLHATESKTSCMFALTTSSRSMLLMWLQSCLC